ncbi:alpha/beta fold hydrolase [Actinokineospora sp. 24-640]
MRSFRTPDGVTLGVEHFGDAAAPLVLLAGGVTMLSWPDALCAALARGGRHVVRYDLRDSGTSTTVDPEAPAYTLRDLAADAAALDCTPRWRERLPELALPTLVVHGRHDPFFPVGNGKALAREIPGARLLVLDHAATAIPDTAADEVATAMLAL